MFDAFAAVKRPPSLLEVVKLPDVTGGWRKLPNEELHGLYCSPSIVRVIKKEETGGACGTHVRGEGCIQHFGWEA
jgi:hypothetical protein